MNPPCALCQREGGVALTASGSFLTPQESVPPYTTRQWLTDERGARVGECWDWEPMCAIHAHRTTEAWWQERRRAREYDRDVRRAAPPARQDPVSAVGDVARDVLGG